VGPAALNHDSPTWFKQAIINPGSVFANPEDVMSSPDLELDEKIRVLRSWQYDAEEEGMRGSQNGMLRRILLLLSELNDGDAIESVAPTKHHGMMNS
jgi:hypothetical protein